MSREGGKVLRVGQQDDAPDLRRFELKDALTPGGNATAHPLDKNDNVDAAAANEFEVYDFHGLYRGRARNAYESPHNRGSRGYARYVGDSGHWEIVQMEPHALKIRGLATAAWTGGTTGDRTIDGVTVMQPIGAIITNTDPAENITVKNPLGCNTSDDGLVFADWDENLNAFVTTQAACP